MVVAADAPTSNLLLSIALLAEADIERVGVSTGTVDL